MLFRQQCTGFFPCAMLLEVTWAILHRVYLCNIVPKELRQHWKVFFLVQCCLEPQEQQYRAGFFLCNVVSRVLRQHWTGISPVQCCLEPHGQHYTRFFPVQCCPRSIKEILHRILSGASCATLRKDLPLQCCPRSFDVTLKRIFLCIVV